MVRNPVKDDSRVFYTWFSGSVTRADSQMPGGYPAIMVYPVYGKRWFTGRTLMAMMAGITVYGAWTRPEKERYSLEMLVEHNERHACHLPYQKAEVNLRTFITAYKRTRFEEECLFTSGVAGLSPEFRKFFYHDDVWRPPLYDVFMNPQVTHGGFWNSYTWSLGYF
jgi:hypothetical protein